MGLVEGAALGALRVAVVALAVYCAYTIRLYAITIYGLVIHEFDPWFNFRATQYLADNGWTAFFQWYDYMSWYPLGRPVGSTIYPGMQITAVELWRGLNRAGVDISLNDVCCYIPAWFGGIASLFTGLLTYETTGSANAATLATLIMAVIPAHLMRSVGGGYDNESIAMTAMMMTFYFWTRSIRTPSSWPVGVLTGLAYFYMVAVWGGYIFVLNMVGVHAVALFFLGQFNSNLHRAYSLFYVIGTLGAIQIPVVGLSPLKSLEQLGPGVVFVAFQVLEAIDVYARANKLTRDGVLKLRLKVCVACCAAGAMVIAALAPTGYFGPLSSRVRGLFVKHTRTGNPLVDSVAEHQPANEKAYLQYLQNIYFIAPVGFVMALFNPRPSRTFLLQYALIASYFSLRMARLIILLGPIASALSGLAFANCIEWIYAQLTDPAIISGAAPAADADADDAAAAKAAAAEAEASKAGGKKGKKGAASPAKASKRSKRVPASKSGSVGSLADLKDRVVGPFMKVYSSPPGRVARLGGALVLAFAIFAFSRSFYAYSHQVAQAISQPSIMFQARLKSGEVIMVDDYREAYWWLRDETPEDSRVMAWWDYGYQIAGIGNRTTIADGNTWNHEHIATLGRALTSPEVEAHRQIRHLADYVLVWAGGGGDDLAKSPHLARIATSVYDNVCPGDPSCRSFGFNADRSPTPMMERSLLYKLHQHGMNPAVSLDPNRFKHVKTTKYGKVRIYKVMAVDTKSKAWVADPANRICDDSGWLCRGQYPPGFQQFLNNRKDFAQLEDFNK